MRAAIVVLLAATVIATIGEHMSGQLLALYGPDNLGLDYDKDHVAMFGAIHAVVAFITWLGVSSPLDRLPALRVGAAAAVAGALVRFTAPVAMQHADPTATFVLFACVLAPMADAILGLSLLLALKRFTDEYYRGYMKSELDAGIEYLFSIQYVVFNMAVVVAHVAYDRMRTYASSVDVANDWVWYITGACLLLTGVLLLVTACTCVRVADHGFTTGDVALGARPCYTLCSGDPELSRLFWRFMGFSTVLIGVRSLFRHFESTMTIYAEAVAGKQAHFALVEAINPLMVALLGVLYALVPLLQWLGVRVPSCSNGFSMYTCTLVGTLVSAGAFIGLGVLLAFGPAGYASSDPMVPLALMAVVFTVGEIIWSPRFTGYAMRVAPKGTEAMFNALARIPSLGGMVLTNYLSGAFIGQFCAQAAGPSAGMSPSPAGGGPAASASCDGASLWTSIGLIGATTPILLLVFARTLREPTIDNKGL